MTAACGRRVTAVRANGRRDRRAWPPQVILVDAIYDEMRAKLEAMTDRMLSKEAELKEVTDERDILSLRVHTMGVELDAARVDVVVAQLRKDYAAAEAARRQSQMEA